MLLKLKRYFVFAANTFRRDTLLLEGSLLVLFCFISVLLREYPASVEAQRIYLGIVLPLSAGIMAANAIVSDPLLEQIASTPFGLVRLLISRLGAITGLVWLAALLYQSTMIILGFDLSHLGAFLPRQISWFLPALVLMGLGTAGSLAFNQKEIGAVCVGLLLVVQAILHEMFLQNGWARLVYLQIGFHRRTGLEAWKTQLVLVFFCVCLVALAVALLRRPDRYIVNR